MIEAGEPRGDLIALSLANTASKTRSQLIRTHRERWLGSALHEVLSTRSTWRNGLLHAVDLRRGVDVDRVDRALVHPELRTVRQLRRRHASIATYIRFAASPQLVRLVDVELHRRQLSGRDRWTPAGPLQRLLLDHAPNDAALDWLTRPAFATVEHVELGTAVRHATIGPQVRLLSDAMHLRTMRVTGYPEEQLRTFFDTPLEALWVWAYGLVRRDGQTVLVQHGWSPPAATERVLESVRTAIARVELHHGNTPGLVDGFEETRRRLSQRFPDLEIRMIEGGDETQTPGARQTP